MHGQADALVKIRTGNSVCSEHQVSYLYLLSNPINVKSQPDRWPVIRDGDSYH